ncbi:Dyp-type peroxidase [Microthyrium microscopicum]|uniref:Dyp-type peroxidase n=1 Tax=Microthyrium microscopicum TaxID=703497 RepID=A0A6A6UU97_9PEZI|nr:Dyp-type peroxidase [Microthyrium microscopicum]
MSQGQSITPQRVEAGLTTAATFLVLSVKRKPEAIKAVRSLLASLPSIASGITVSKDALIYTIGIGSQIWDEVTSLPRPSELHPFPEVKGAKHTAVSTPGDLLFHIRAERRDITFEFERQVLDKLGDAVKVVDETVGFRYFDLRDLLGFVDGTANPTGQELHDSVIIGDEDKAAAGGSYIVVQKYLHNLAGWNKLPKEQQEAIVGRTKPDDVELDDAAPGEQAAHKTLATIADDNGEEYDILRDNMPFGSPASGEYGTYFIGYSRRLWVIEKMMERMFIGEPVGKHDRILDYSKAVTGTTFFAPSATALASIES